MIYLPWIAFFLGMAWMIHQAYKAKKQYLRRKAEEQDRARATEEQKLAAPRENKALGTI
jgi:hypothetical protein